MRTGWKSFTPLGLGALAVFLLAVWSGAAQATTKEETIELCKAEMFEKQGAKAVASLDYRRHDRVPYVYGDASFDKVPLIHFRCRIYQGRVTSVKYLVPDPNLAGGKGWVKIRPPKHKPEDAVLDEASKAPPPETLVEPHFEKVPTN